jgi:hypothetical protein
VSERIYSSSHHTTTPTYLSFSTYHNISKYKKITIYLCVYILIFCSPPITILYTTKKHTFFSRLPLILNITSTTSPPYVIQKKHAVISIPLLPSYPFVYLPCFRTLRSYTRYVPYYSLTSYCYPSFPHYYSSLCLGYYLLLFNNQIK